MKSKLLTIANHGTMLNLGCYRRVSFVNTPQARIVKKHCSPKKKKNPIQGLVCWEGL